MPSVLGAGWVCLLPGPSGAGCDQGMEWLPPPASLEWLPPPASLRASGDQQCPEVPTAVFIELWRFQAHPWEELCPVPGMGPVSEQQSAGIAHFLKPSTPPFTKGGCGVCVRGWLTSSLSLP